MKHKIIFEKDFETKGNEQELINDIQKDEFFAWMIKKGYKYNDIKNIFDDKKLSAGEQSRFNETLRNIKKETTISLTEALVFLEETFVKFKRILSILDNETKFELKKELSQKYKIDLDENTLSQILG